MAVMELNTGAWAERQFGTCELGDERRAKRLIKLAAAVAEKPDASTPQQTEDWADCKAAYRLFARPEVTFEAVTSPHCAQTREAAPKFALILNDTTEINYGGERQIEGVGRVGSTDSLGFYLHSALMIDGTSGEITGLAAQDLYKRPLKKVQRVSSAERKKLARETDVWGRVIDRVGPPPAGKQYLHICDRGADNFDIYCHLLQQRADWVIRAAQLTRKVRDAEKQKIALDAVVRAQPCGGSYELQVQENKDQPARTATLEVRWTPVVLPRPRGGVSSYVRECGVKQIAMWVVDGREVRPPRGVDPLRWVLLTSVPVANFEAAWQTIEWYEKRPLIEEYHKCLKTGCSVEQRQYQFADRLEPVIGLLSVLAVRLLSLKTIARAEPERRASGLVPSDWLKALALQLRRPRKTTSVRDFFRAVASLGGFLGRKSDGEPGWQTIWRGMHQLLIAVRTMNAAERCG